MGTCRLRDAIAAKNAGAATGTTITFDATAFPTGTPTTITLNSGTLTLSASVTIDGTGHRVVVDGGCTFSNGACTGGGVTVFIVNSGVTAALIALGIQHGNGGIAGGIANSGTLTVTSSTLSGNNSTGGAGGGGIANVATLTVTNSTLAGNSTDYEGGAIFNNGGTVTATNSTLSGNTATLFGGGIMNKGTGAAVTLTNTTVSGNSAGTGGGGISGPGTLNLTNTIVAGNMPFDINGVQGTNNHSLVGGNPLLAALASNGGPTQTMAPLPGSPVIGAGDPAVCISTTIPAAAPVGGKDQRGVTRPTTLCAIGAFEPLLSAIFPPSGSVTGGATVTLTGAGLAAGATVTIGNVPCTNVVIVNSTALRCTTGAHGVGVVDVTVTVGSQAGTLLGGYTYGVVAGLPGPQPTRGSGSNPVPLPPTRPPGSPVNNTPIPLPPPRP
ncbi:MAG: IPT/TIG domain-containing protein [Thermomicrobiales bacterium]